MRFTIISIVPILHYSYLDRTTMPSCRFCRRFFQHAGTLENHVEWEHPPFFRASPIDRQANSSLDLEPSDTETSNAELHNTGIGPHGWDFAPSSPTCDTSHRTPDCSSAGSSSDIPFYSRATLVPPHPDHPRYGVLRQDDESDPLDESTTLRDGFYPRGIEKGYCFPLHHGPTCDERNFRTLIRKPDPCHPFKSEKEFNFTTWLVESGLPVSHIDMLLKGNFPLDPSLSRCFQSWYLLKKQLEELDFDLGMASWQVGTCDVKWSEDSNELVKFYYRVLKEVAKWLHRQPYHEENMV